MATPLQKVKLGDRVRVSDSYFQECLRGVSGTISQPPNEALRPDTEWHDFWRVEDQNTRVYWVVFDDMIRDEGNELVEASEISEMDLRFLP